MKGQERNSTEQWEKANRPHLVLMAFDLRFDATLIRMSAALTFVAPMELLSVARLPEGRNGLTRSSSTATALRSSMALDCAYSRGAAKTSASSSPRPIER